MDDNLATDSDGRQWLWNPPYLDLASLCACISQMILNRLLTSHTSLCLVLKIHQDHHIHSTKHLPAQHSGGLFAASCYPQPPPPRLVCNTAYRKQIISLMDIKRVSCCVLCRTWAFSLEWKWAGNRGEIGRINEVGGPELRASTPPTFPAPPQWGHLSWHFQTEAVPRFLQQQVAFLHQQRLCSFSQVQRTSRPDIEEEFRDQRIPRAAKSSWSWRMWPPLKLKATETLASRWAEISFIFRTK